MPFAVLVLKCYSVWLGYHAIVALGCFGRVRSAAPFGTRNRAQILVEERHIVKVEGLVRWVICAREDVVGFRYPTESPVEHLPITWRVRQSRAQAARLIHGENIPIGAG
jgi:hypothetical protein